MLIDFTYLGSNDYWCEIAVDPTIILNLYVAYSSNIVASIFSTWGRALLGCHSCSTSHLWGFMHPVRFKCSCFDYGFSIWL